MRQTKLSGEEKFGEKIVKINLQVILFEEDGIYFAYMPPLDLTGYGYNYDEARKSLEIVLDEFFTYTFNKKTFFTELQRLGWTIKSKKKPMVPPEMSNLINTNAQLREIINHKQFSTSNYPVNVPAFA